MHKTRMEMYHPSKNHKNLLVTGVTLAAMAATVAFTQASGSAYADSTGDAGSTASASGSAASSTNSVTLGSSSASADSSAAGSAVSTASAGSSAASTASAGSSAASTASSTADSSSAANSTSTSDSSSAAASSASATTVLSTDDGAVNITAGTDGYTVSGTGTAGNIAEIVDANKNIIASGQIASDGSFSFVITDQSFDPTSSSYSYQEEPSPTTADYSSPEMVKTATGYAFTGSGTAGNTINIQDASGNVVFTGTVAADGHYEIDVAENAIDPTASYYAVEVPAAGSTTKLATTTGSASAVGQRSSTSSSTLASGSSSRSTSATTLPQTGESNYTAESVLGLSGLSLLLGFMGLSRRKA